jgi:D-galactonate transporter
LTDRPTAQLAEANRVYAKVFGRIVPFLMLCYVVAYLDRVNVGFAKLQMARDLGFSDTVYGLGAGLFFIGYFLFEVPSNLILAKVGARAWIARIMVTWGVLSAAFVFVNSAWAFYVLRFLLGAAEAGFYPGIIYYLTTWFPARRRTRVIAVFMAAIPVSGVLGNPLSGWIMQSLSGAAGLAGWRWMFLIEAAPAILVGLAIFLFLADRPGTARWLAPAEAALIEDEVTAEAAAKTDGPDALADVLQDKRVWFYSLIYFTFIAGQYGLTLWMPTLVEASGVSGPLRIGFVSAIPYLFAVVMMVAVGHSSDSRNEWRWHIIVPAICGALGFVVAATAKDTTVAITFLSLAAGGVLTCAPLFWALPTSLLRGSAAAAGLALINSVGNLAGFASPYAIGALRDRTGDGAAGMYALAAILLAGALCVFAERGRPPPG